jgi:four helix bundle protein
MSSFKDLEAWREGMNLVEGCYRATSAFPQVEQYGLSSQLRRAAVSIPSNIAEGHCRRTTNAYLNHISIALGSQGEVATCVEIAHRLKLIESNHHTELAAQADTVGRLLYGLYRALEAKLR